jgi:hypothetical protein
MLFTVMCQNSLAYFKDNDHPMAIADLSLSFIDRVTGQPLIEEKNGLKKGIMSGSVHPPSKDKMGKNSPFSARRLILALGYNYYQLL